MSLSRKVKITLDFREESGIVNIDERLGAPLTQTFIIVIPRKIRNKTVVAKPEGVQKVKLRDEAIFQQQKARLLQSLGEASLRKDIRRFQKHAYLRNLRRIA